MEGSGIMKLRNINGYVQIATNIFYLPYMADNRAMAIYICLGYSSHLSHPHRRLAYSVHMLHSDDNQINQLRKMADDLMASASDPKSLQSFRDAWITLTENMLENSPPGSANPELSTLMNTVAMRIHAIATGFLGIYAPGNLNSDFISPKDPVEQSTFKDEEIRACAPRHPRHVPTLHSWIMKNIHNPYPSSIEKDKLSSESHMSAKAISEWFASVRRRIGWNSISSRYFRGRRSETIDCAIRILVERSDHPYSEDVVQEFEKMREAAAHLLDEQNERSERLQRQDSTMASREINSIKKRSRTMTPDTSEIANDTIDQKSKRRKVSGASVDSALTPNEASDNQLSVFPRTVSSSTDRTYINDSPTVEKRDLISSAVTAKHSRCAILVLLDLKLIMENAGLQTSLRHPRSLITRLPYVHLDRQPANHLRLLLQNLHI